MKKDASLRILEAALSSHDMFRGLSSTKLDGDISSIVNRNLSMLFLTLVTSSRCFPFA